MKNLLLMFSLVLFTVGYSQDTVQTGITGENDELVMKGDITHELSGPTLFSYNGQEYLFTPDDLGYTISKLENGKETEFGTLRSTSSEGYYILTCNENEESSFGRFDENGDFRALRYDIESDEVKEENFIHQGEHPENQKEQRH